MSADRRWVLAAAEPATVVLYDGTLRRVRSWPAASLDGQRASAVTDVRDNAPRRSFLVSFATLPELWEVSYDRAAEPIFDGLVHDYRMGEGIAREGFLGVRRTPLEQPFTVLALTADGRRVAGATARAPAAGSWLDLVHLDVRRRIARVELQVTPTPATAAAFVRDGRELIALGGPEGLLQVVDPAAARVLQTHAVGKVLSVREGPGATELSVGVEPPGGGTASVLRLDKHTLALQP